MANQPQHLILKGTLIWVFIIVAVIISYAINHGSYIGKPTLEENEGTITQVQCEKLRKGHSLLLGITLDSSNSYSFNNPPRSKYTFNCLKNSKKYFVGLHTKILTDPLNKQIYEWHLSDKQMFSYAQQIEWKKNIKLLFLFFGLLFLAMLTVCLYRQKYKKQPHSE